jgi:hypothetical protein
METAGCLETLITTYEASKHRHHISDIATFEVLKVVAMEDFLLVGYEGM